MNELDESKWLKQYEREVEIMTQRYEELNKASPVYTYTAYTEDDFERTKYDRMDDTWIKI